MLRKKQAVRTVGMKASVRCDFGGGFTTWLLSFTRDKEMALDFTYAILILRCCLGAIFFVSNRIENYIQQGCDFSQ